MSKGYMRGDREKKKGKITKAKAEYFEGKDIEKDKMKSKESKTARSLAC